MQSIIQKLNILKKDNQNIAGIIAKELYKNFLDGNFSSLKQLSEICHVSESTITVFAKKIGYSGYRELLFVLKLENQNYQENAKLENINDFLDLLNTFNQNLTDNLFWKQSLKKVIIDLVQKIKVSENIFLYSSYQLDDLAKNFSEILSLKKRYVFYNPTKLYAYKNIEKVNSNDLAIFFVSGQDNEMLEYIFKKVKKLTSNIFIFSSRSQKDKFEIFQNTFILDLNNLSNDNVYRHLVLQYIISLVFYLL